MIKSLALLAGVVAATDLCVPDAFQTYYHRYTDMEDVIPFRRPQEFRSGDFLRIVVDETAQKTLVWVHEENYSNDPDHGVLTDYTKGYRWEWDWDAQTKTIKNCKLEKTDDKLEKLCLSHRAEKKGDVYLGKDLRVDVYAEHVFEPLLVNEEIETQMEYGSTTIPVSQKVRGKAHKEPAQELFYYSHEEFFDFSDSPVDPKMFDVPSECPN